MRVALALARRGLGLVWPNPAVGCVIVNGDTVVGRGWTRRGGRPHAETEALGRAGDKSKGATAYVTLEPCPHQGETPPCTQALIDAGLARLVMATEDPDSRVSGQGAARLQAAGISVESGVLEEEARDLNAGYLLRVRQGRPLITLKSATTLDGRIATRTGESQWITGPVARDLVHGMRADHDAILTSVGTVLADDPRLTCRLPGMEDSSPLRIIADSHLQIPLTSKLVQSAGAIPTWVITVKGGDRMRIKALGDCGVTVIEAEPGADVHPDPRWMAEEFGRRGLTRVLVEGGGHLAAALLRAGLVDRLAWFRNPRVIGGAGLPASVDFGVQSLAEAPEFIRSGLTSVGGDVLETYYRAG
jgi:diaminohydroxyphosphoribosylaminopyrimidine deaminase/5-amino-6-(5-phosphoribosylamino)uracil reductase